MGAADLTPNIPRLRVVMKMKMVRVRFRVMVMYEV